MATSWLHIGPSESMDTTFEYTMMSIFRSPIESGFDF